MDLKVSPDLYMGGTRLDKLNIVIMGKTGAGKSTLLNAIIEEGIAPTGSGQAVTKENVVYSRKLLLPLGMENTNGSYGLIGKKVNLYDTIGLEIDNKITDKTLDEIQEFVTKARDDEEENDVTVILFCVNYRSNRFEVYERDLIKTLSVNYEIPFVIALTQCIDEDESEIEKQLKRDLPEIAVTRVLAKDYKIRGGIVKAFGIPELLRSAILDYNESKIFILKTKLLKLKKEKEKRIEHLRESGQCYINDYSDKAMKVGIVPVGCIPIIHGICIKMLVDLNSMVGINSTKGFATDIFVNVVVGMIATPFLAVPLLSAGVASAYISAVGETYLDALINAIECSMDWELKNNELMSKRITEELNKRKG